MLHVCLLLLLFRYLKIIPVQDHSCWIKRLNSAFTSKCLCFTLITKSAYYAESLYSAITMLFLFTVLCVHMVGRVCGGVCVSLCFGSFTLKFHCYWLDCSHPPNHPIATIATDGAAGINAPGTASLINGRLTQCLISDLSLL